MLESRKCDYCEKPAEFICDYAFSSFCCTTHASIQRNTNRIYQYPRESVILSSEDICILRQAFNDQQNIRIQRVLQKRESELCSLFRQISLLEKEYMNEVDHISKDERKAIIDQICTRQSIPLASSIPLVTSLAKLKRQRQFYQEDILRELLSDLSYGLLHTFEGHADGVKAIAISDCNQFLATASRDEFIKVWRIPSAQLLRTLKGHTRWVKTVAFLGNKIISGSEDKTIKIWEQEQCIKTLEFHTDYVTNVCVSSDKTLAASSSWDKKIVLWNTQDGLVRRKLTGHSEAVYIVDFSPDDKQIASASRDATIKVWSTSTGQLIRTLQGHSSYVTSLKFSERCIISSSFDKTLKIWGTTNYECLRTLTEHTSKVVEVDVFGNTAASLAMDNTIKVWNIETGRLIQTLEGHGEYPREQYWFKMGLKFSSDGQFLISAGQDRLIKFWEKLY